MSASSWRSRDERCRSREIVRCSGRSRECDIRLADANVSRRHAEVRREEGAYWIVDLGSTNGTELNGRRIERERLSDGDRITLGSTDVRFGHEHS